MVAFCGAPATLGERNGGLRVMKGIAARLEMVLGIILTGWGLFTNDPMSVAIGFPFFLDAASNLRFERVEGRIAELGEQRAEVR